MSPALTPWTDKVSPRGSPTRTPRPFGRRPANGPWFRSSSTPCHRRRIDCTGSKGRALLSDSEPRAVSSIQKQRGRRIMIEIYADQVAEKPEADTRLAFVTHNVRDFSEAGGDQRKPHADLLPLFDGTVSSYSILLLDVINRIDEDLLANH